MLQALLKSPPRAAVSAFHAEGTLFDSEGIRMLLQPARLWKSMTLRAAALL